MKKLINYFVVLTLFFPFLVQGGENPPEPQELPLSFFLPLEEAPPCYRLPYSQKENWEEVLSTSREKSFTLKFIFPEGLIEIISVRKSKERLKMKITGPTYLDFCEKEREWIDLFGKGFTEKGFDKYKYKNKEGKIKEFFDLFFYKGFIPPFFIGGLLRKFPIQSLWDLPMNKFIIQSLMEGVSFEDYLSTLNTHLVRYVNQRIIQQKKVEFMMHMLSVFRQQKISYFYFVFLQFANNVKMSFLTSEMKRSVSLIKAEILYYRSFLENPSKAQDTKIEALETFYKTLEEDPSSSLKGQIQQWVEIILQDVLKEPCPCELKPFLGKHRTAGGFIQGYLLGKLKANQFFQPRLKNLTEENERLKNENSTLKRKREEVEEGVIERPNFTLESPPTPVFSIEEIFSEINGYFPSSLSNFNKLEEEKSVLPLLNLDYEKSI